MSVLGLVMMIWRWVRGALVFAAVFCCWRFRRQIIITNPNTNITDLVDVRNAVNKALRDAGAPSNLNIVINQMVWARTSEVAVVKGATALLI